MSGRADISVVIPVKNGAPEIRACVSGILSQTVRPIEIIAVDSGSSDETLDLLSEFEIVRVIEIPPEQFNHGETRNLGAREARGAMVLFTVQDARAVSVAWIEELLRGMTDDRVAGVCGAQVVPHDRDKNPVEWFRPQSRPKMSRVQFEEAQDFLKLSPREKKQVLSWDNVNALYRRDALLAIPFERTEFAEDILWARAALLAGWALVYNPSARVFHYHNETKDFAFRRAAASLYFRYIAAGDVPSPSSLTRAMMRAAKCLVLEPSISWAERRYWLQYNWSNNLAVRDAIKLFQAAAANGSDAVEDFRRRHLGAAIVPAKPFLVGSKG